MSEQKTVEAKVDTRTAQAKTIFAGQLKKWVAGKFKTSARPYRDFRRDTMNLFVEKIGVSVAAAATLFNSLKKDALAADKELVIQRDPKIVRAKSDRKPGRPRKDAEQETAAAEQETAA